MEDEIKKIITYCKNPNFKNFCNMEKETKYFFGLELKTLSHLSTFSFYPKNKI
jgi:hypothetical protein